MTTPAVLYAEARDEREQLWSLALVRTRWAGEGQLILERADADELDMVEQGSWYRRGSDEGPCALSVEIPGLENDEDAAIVNRLLAKLVKAGASWGLETYEAYQ